MEDNRRDGRSKKKWFKDTKENINACGQQIVMDKEKIRVGDCKGLRR